MARSMLIWTTVLLVGIPILIIYPMPRSEAPPDAAGGFGAVLMVPFGCFLALVGAGGRFVARVRGCAR